MSLVENAFKTARQRADEAERERIEKGNYSDTISHLPTSRDPMAAQRANTARLHENMTIDAEHDVIKRARTASGELQPDAPRTPNEGWTNTLPYLNAGKDPIGDLVYGKANNGKR